MDHKRTDTNQIPAQGQAEPEESVPPPLPNPEPPIWEPSTPYEVRVMSTEPMEVIDTRSDAEKIKERQIAYMTAALMWFLLFCAFGVAGAFVFKLILVIL